MGLSLGYGTQDVQWQITLGSDSGILEMGDYQDVCVNASVTGGACHSDKNIWQAGGKSWEFEKERAGGYLHACIGITDLAGVDLPDRIIKILNYIKK